MSTTSTYKEYGQLGTLPVEDLDNLINVPELPAVTSEDDGKILKVVDGKWKAVLPETPEPPEETVEEPQET